MKIDLNTALTYYFKDRCLFKKIIPMYLIITVCVFIPIVGLLLIPLIFGYLAVNTNSRIFTPDDNTLYEWVDIGYFYKIGCKIIEPFWISLIPLICGIMIYTFFAVLGGLGGPRGGSALDLGVLFFLILTLISLPLVLFYFLPAYLSFVINLEHESLFNFKVLNFISSKNHHKDYLRLLWYYFLFTLVLLVIPPAGFLLPFIFLAFVDINAQFIRQAFEIDINKNEITN